MSCCYCDPTASGRLSDPSCECRCHEGARLMLKGIGHEWRLNGQKPPPINQQKIDPTLPVWTRPEPRSGRPTSNVWPKEAS